MKRLFIVISVAFAFGGTSFVGADEIGPAKPNSSSSATSTTIQSTPSPETTETCTLLDLLTGQCEES